MKNYKLPNMETKIHVQMVGAESGINWVGDFVYRRPNLQERGMIDVMRTRLNGDLITLDPDVSAFHEALAHLRFTLKEFPDWWKDSGFGATLYDANVIIEVYNKSMEFEATWKKKIHGTEPAEVEAGNENKEPVGATAGL